MDRTRTSASKASASSCSAAGRGWGRARRGCWPHAGADVAVADLESASARERVAVSAVGSRHAAGGRRHRRRRARRRDRAAPKPSSAARRPGHHHRHGRVGAARRHDHRHLGPRPPAQPPLLLHRRPRGGASRCIARDTPGSIVCVASIDGIRSAAGHASYGAAKAGLVNLVKTMTAEWSGHGIRVERDRAGRR